MRYAFILGRNPELSIAELGAFFGAALQVAPNRAVAFSNSLPGEADAQTFLNRLGGCTEILDIFAENLPISAIEKPIHDYLLKRAEGHDGKFAFAINLIPETKNTKMLKFLLTTMKKNLRAEGVRANFMNNNFKNVSAVFAAQEGLVKSGTNVSIIEVGGGKVALGVSIAMQNFEGYSKRDFGKPFRDANTGMLPPKLAQIMVNVAAPVIASELSLRAPLSGTKQSSLDRFADARDDIKIFDPFCGSGTILMEALLMGFSVIGSDKDARQVAGAQQNVDWLRQTFPKSVHVNTTVQLFQKDATAALVIASGLSLRGGQRPTKQSGAKAPSRASGEGSNGFADARHDTTSPQAHFAIATEPHLGPPLSQFPAENFLKKVVADLSALYLAFFKNLAAHAAPKTPIVFIFPYWKRPAGAQPVHMTGIVPKIESLGFSSTRIGTYDRPDSVVGRELFRFIKK